MAIFTVLLVLGTKLSARVGNIFTLIKIAVVLFVIVVGFTYVKFENYAPFVPAAEPTAATGTADVLKQSFFGFLTGAAPAQYGTLGIFAGAALVFFAFIGFDVVATSAEEVKNPQKTLPRGIFGGLAIVTRPLHPGLPRPDRHGVLHRAGRSQEPHPHHRLRSRGRHRRRQGHRLRLPGRPDHRDHGAAAWACPA